MFKNILKTVWIALLSASIKLIAQNLTKAGFVGLPKLGAIPLEYLVINIIIFSALTILFIYIESYLPFNSMFKGIAYTILISIIWIALIFQPEMFENFRSYLIGVGVFFLPMMVFGMLLGYLSTSKKNKFIVTKDLFKYFIIAVFWLGFHAIYMTFIPPNKTQIANYGIWLLTASAVISIIVGFFYEIHIGSKYNTLLITSIIILVVFSTFYLDRFATNKSFRWEFFIRLLLDVVSIILSIQVIELYITRFRVDILKKLERKEEDNKKSLHK